MTSPETPIQHAFAILRSGRPADALPLFLSLVEQHPEDPASWDGLATTYRALGKLGEAVQTYTRGLERHRNNAGLYNNMGLAYRAAGDDRSALRALQAAAMNEPNWPQPLANLSSLFRDVGELDKSAKCLMRAIALAPDDAELQNNLGGLKERQGDVDGAIEAYRKAAEMSPENSKIHSNLLYIFHFAESSTVASLVAEHAEFQRRHADPLAAELVARPRQPTQGRRLRIGYVSPDFRYHPVGRFMLPILRHHDQSKFEIFCYATMPRPADGVTAELQKHAEHWKDITSYSDAAAADLIRSDNIDILIDLTMHMSFNRQLLFARKPAPVQICYLAYNSTTGLSAMDYRISDPHFDPPDTEEEYRELTLKLPQTYWCYEPRSEAPVGPLPALTRGYLTFGNLNNANKLSASAMKTYCEILKVVPTSRLLLHAGEGSPRNRIIDLAKFAGIDTGRIDFMGFAPVDEYYATYNRIDIALDPFPYAGGTTTCDALFMGVPTLTLAGQTPVGRGGVSILRNMNLHDWIAQSPAEYVAKAAAFARDLDALSELRGTLRKRMQASPLMDAPTFVKDLEALLETAAR